MNVPDMNPDMNVYHSVPPRYTKNQAVFGKYAASQAGLQGGWSPDVFNPNSPMLYGMPVTPHHALGSIKQEMMTPESFQTGTISPGDMLNADDSPLFDEIDNGDMQQWDSLFLDENTRQQQQPPVAGTEKSEGPNTELPAFNFDTDGLDFSSMNKDSRESVGSNRPVSIPGTKNLENNDDLFGLSLDFSVLNEEEHSTEPTVVSSRPTLVKSELPDSPSFNTVSSGRVTKAKSNSPPSSTTKKVDDLGITVYKRKPRTLPLKPVEVDEDCGDVAVKRAKNTEAARRSRARKLERMSQLELRVRELMDENEQLRAEIVSLKGE